GDEVDVEIGRQSRDAGGARRAHPQGLATPAAGDGLIVSCPWRGDSCGRGRAPITATGAPISIAAPAGGGEPGQRWTTRRVVRPPVPGPDRPPRDDVDSLNQTLTAPRPCAPSRALRARPARSR